MMHLPEDDTVELVVPLPFVDGAARMLARLPDTDEARELVGRIYGHDVVAEAVKSAGKARG